jgi:hypothetical protein
MIKKHWQKEKNQYANNTFNLFRHHRSSSFALQFDQDVFEYRWIVMMLPKIHK